MSSIEMLYERVLTSRIEEEAREMAIQSGCRPGRSCVDNIFTIKQLAEKRLARGMELHATFTDLRKAFDSAPLQKLWMAMKEAGINSLYINAIKTLHGKNQAVAKVRNQTSEAFSPTKEVEQGSCLSPTLFRIYLCNALKQWIKKYSPMGIWIEDTYMYTILFANDEVVLAEDQQDMTYMINKLIEEFTKWGLKINIQKTQYTIIGGTRQDFETESGIIKNVRNLGVTIDDDGKDHKDILKKIGKEKI